MKRIIIVIKVLVCVSLFIGCTKSISINNSSKCPNLRLSDSDNYVRIGDVISFVNGACSFTKTRGIDYSVAPYTSAQGDTLLYIVNYGNGEGWQILSSDARTPAVIAYGDRGSFSLEDGSPGLQAWMDCMATDISIIKRSKDSELSFSEDEIAANKAVWAGPRPRALDDPQLPNPDGTWWVSTTSEIIVVDSLNHMTPQWIQHAPYNRYCPYVNTNTGERALAGCVSVASSNVLYYLHDTLGVPPSMYTQCVNETTYQNNLPEFYAAEMGAWATMDTLCHGIADPVGAESILLSWAGFTMGASYGPNSTTTTLSQVWNVFFPQCGISCSHRSYSQDTVKKYLNKKIPVIVSASKDIIPTHHHVFVIDGYKKTYTKYTYHHVFHPADPEAPFPPGCESYYTYSQTSPAVSAIKINWGWHTQWDPNNPKNDGWYALTANWHDENFDSNYHYDVTMIYNFRVAN